MIPFRQIQNALRLACGLALVLCVLGRGSLAAQTVETEELKITLRAAREKIRKLEAALLAAEKKNENLGEALAAANAEAAQFRESYTETKQQIEALGLSALDPNEKALQERLLKALGDLRLVEEHNQKLSDQILSINEAVLQYLNSAVNADQDATALLEKAMEESTASLGLIARNDVPGHARGTLHTAKVVSLKPDLDLVVLNIGRANGARIGMPFQLIRKDRPVGTAILVDVRDEISGAIVQTLFSDGENIQVGDHAKIDTKKSL